VPDNAIETIRLLVVSREPSVLRPLCSIGESNAWHLETAGSGWDALERVQSGVVPDLLILDIPRGDGDCLHILRWLRRFRPDLPIILLSDPDDGTRRSEAMRLGAQDYLVRPFEERELEQAIRRHLEPSGAEVDADIASEDIEALAGGAFFVGATPIMQKLRAQAELLGQADVPVLILGENGSGKDTAARLIHKLSVRSSCKFVKVSCAALPEELLETELFGSEGGSSGSPRPKPGKFEICDKGTILLDDIDEMPVRLQAKLVQVLQEKRLTRAGGKTPIPIDVRILAATSANVDRVLSEKKLREDLYYRLSAFTLHVPPLRQRREEIPLLLHHVMHQVAKHYGMAPRPYTRAVLDSCQSHEWPGNLKELESFVKRYLVMGDKNLTFGQLDFEEPNGENGKRIETGVLTIRVRETEGAVENSAGPSSLKSLVQTVKLETERTAIAAALDRTGWNRKAAARLLRVSYRTLLYKIEQYHMRAPEAYPSSVGNGLKGNGNGWKTG